ncbi:MAG: ABC transporter substrate-binding protein [Desulfovibrionaceae bacterium]|nr:ABC transporter substrate-binding protein [Desulfovibrionaceae bacterium]
MPAIAALRLFVLVFCLTFAVQADAAQLSPARQALETSTNRILDCIRNPDYANPATRGPLRQQLEDEVLHIFDFTEFAARTVGARWRSFTPAQQKAFSDAFADLLMNTYISKIDGYNGEQVSYVGEVSDGKRSEVRTVVTMKDGKKVPVAYRMLPKGGGWRVYDVLIEGISLVKNYRTQFQDILTTASPDELTARVQEKAREMRRQEGK